MDLSSFLPFRDEMVKVYHCLTNNATHTSEKPVFSELKVRRYSCPLENVSDFITNKIEGWVGWELKSQKTAVGGMKTIRAEVSSFALLGMKIDVTFGLVEETDINGRKITTVNGKAHTRIDSKGDLGESRRMLRMMLASLDFEFRPQIVHEDEYVHRSIDPKNSNAAFQQLFDESTLEHRPSTPKAKSIELKNRLKTDRVQVIQEQWRNCNGPHLISGHTSRYERRTDNHCPGFGCRRGEETGKTENYRYLPEKKFIKGLSFHESNPVGRAGRRQRNTGTIYF
ncbi:hypothetical protein NY406_05000 [Chlorobaculum sp. MV4-Y]|uniref:hypothetical protein n=1 Tax=Chlorobaculum sp. MV4-Y TaxID=2976335 RepID=UPI0021AFA844|nr:hypothetical protein [Chlorobaculum sp. MV4-Y]UWX58624.1 hypothetical protein NY406_05000 [Chlorobaculum sp. MV4-Y]